MSKLSEITTPRLRELITAQQAAKAATAATAPESQDELEDTLEALQAELATREAALRHNVRVRLFGALRQVNVETLANTANTGLTQDDVKVVAFEEMDELVSDDAHLTSVLEGTVTE